MTSTATLFSEIFEITRGDLENASFPYVGAAEYLRGMSSLRLLRISQFWKNGESEDPLAFFNASQDFVGGLFGQACSWAFFLLGLPNEIQCWFAAALRANNGETPNPL